MTTLYKWLYQHAIVTLLLILWSICLISWVVWRVFGDNPPEISGGTATAFATVFGLPALVVGLWKWRNGGE